MWFSSCWVSLHFWRSPKGLRWVRARLIAWKAWCSLLELYLPWLKSNEFFVCWVQGINTPGFPLFCCSPSGLQEHHKGFSVASLSHISYSDVLSVWGSIFYLHLVLSFPVWASQFVCFQGFSHFSIFELFLSAGPSPCPTLFSSCSLFCIWDYSSSLFLFISLLLALISLSLAPCFLSLILLFPSQRPLTKHPLPTPYLKPLKRRSH